MRSIKYGCKIYMTVYLKGSLPRYYTDRKMKKIELSGWFKSKQRMRKNFLAAN